MSRILLLAALLAALLLAPGCAAVVAGAAAAGTIQYVRNEAHRDYPATLEATWAATLEGLRDTGHPVDPTARYGSDGGKLEINDVTVQVRAGQGDTTRVWVRVGTFDTDANRDRARRILDAIGKRLGV